jgi:hypothetical protein
VASVRFYYCMKTFVLFDVDTLRHASNRTGGLLAILCKATENPLLFLCAEVWPDNISVPEAIPRPRLERPLPWVLFLPLLVCLRLVKMAADVVTCLTGKEPLSPAQVVRFLRVRRRRLRAVKYQGLRNFQRWQQTKLDNKQVRLHTQASTDNTP